MKNCKAQLGAVVHAAKEQPNYSGNAGQVFTALFPVCGKRIGRRSLTHGYLETGKPVNCPECLKHIARA